MRHHRAGYNEWLEIGRKRGFKLGCCDCGLFHDIDFAIVRRGRGHRLFLRARRNARSTALARRRPQVCKKA